MTTNMKITGHDGNVQELDALCWAAERADIERRTIVIPVRYHEEAVQALADDGWTVLGAHETERDSVIVCERRLSHIP